MDPSKRERILWNIGELLLKHRDELAAIISQENGKTLREAAGADVAPAADCFRYYAGWVRKIYGETIPVDGPYFNYTLREPVGVVGAIVPWNFPLQIAAWKVAPALACGCSVVLKPSELTPLNALRFAEIAREAGLPEGVLNVVTGYGETTGEALALHEDVDKISFTGSIATARKLLQNSAVSNLKRLSLELGGKSPNIIFPDADIDAAMKAAFWGIFGNKGEMCTRRRRACWCTRTSTTAFWTSSPARAQKLRVGNPLDPATPDGLADLGAADGSHPGLHRERQAGGRARCWPAASAIPRATRPRASSSSRRSSPTCSPRCGSRSEEIFGPVVSAIRFRDAEEAVRIANGTIYGLAAAVWTRDIKLAHRMAAEIKAGSVWINTYNALRFRRRRSAATSRAASAATSAPYALEQYTNVKSVWVAL